MVFCNKNTLLLKKNRGYCHNPYFSRWFSAISQLYFMERPKKSHNPYFSRWFSAIQEVLDDKSKAEESQSLF